MPKLSIENKEFIENFININNANNNFPMISPSKRNINKIFKQFVESNDDLEQYGSEGHSYNNCFYKHSNGRVYIVTYDMGQLKTYYNFNEGDIDKLKM